MLAFTFVALAGCTGGLDFERGCLDRHLDRWCNHTENGEWPMGEGGCPSAVPPDDAAPDGLCGDYLVTGFSGGFTGVEHYFLDGEHVATKHWTDVNHYCGGFVYWYGKRVRCD